MNRNDSVHISVILPVRVLDEVDREYFGVCLESLLSQNFSGSWEVSIYDDGSTDQARQVIEEFTPKFRGIGVKVVYNRGNVSKGVGFAKNKAVRASSGRYLCFCDADDVNFTTRLRDQFDAANILIQSTGNPFVLVGSQFIRCPANSTERYARWANSLDKEQITQQIYTSHGPTIIMPTWFISRELFDKLSGFLEISKGFPEDLEFFYRVIDAGSLLHKVEKPLITYRYHPNCASFGVSEEIIWNMRLERLKRSVFPSWSNFTIWNAGKQGKRFFKNLSFDEQKKVMAFCDVDAKKIQRGVYELYDEVQRKITRKIPIIKVSEAVPPLIICVKLDMTSGDFEELLMKMNWKEGSDYILFS